MWGIWMLLIVGFAGVALLVMALAVGAAPLFAMLIFLLAAAAIGAGFALKRGSEYVKGRDAELKGDESAPWTAARAARPGAQKPSGEPVAGEGGDPVHSAAR
jgi:hypothetical protein